MTYDPLTHSLLLTEKRTSGSRALAYAVEHAGLAILCRLSRVDAEGHTLRMGRVPVRDDEVVMEEMGCCEASPCTRVRRTTAELPNRHRSVSWIGVVVDGAPNPTLFVAVGVAVLCKRRISRDYERDVRIGRNRFILTARHHRLSVPLTVALAPLCAPAAVGNDRPHDVLIEECREHLDTLPQLADLIRSWKLGEIAWIEDVLREGIRLEYLLVANEGLRIVNRRPQKFHRWLGKMKSLRTIAIRKPLEVVKRENRRHLLRCKTQPDFRRCDSLRNNLLQLRN